MTGISRILRRLLPQEWSKISPNVISDVHFKKFKRNFQKDETISKKLNYNQEKMFSDIYGNKKYPAARR